MADVPDGIVLKYHRDLHGMRKTLWPRRLITGALGGVAVLGLLYGFVAGYLFGYLIGAVYNRLVPPA